MDKIIEEYPPDYCHLLEAAYGKGMMSEGGTQSIDYTFNDLSINGKKALDIGSGLGGMAFHLAQKYDVDVTGLEINPWMVEESVRNIPREVQNRVHFVQNASNEMLPFEDESFDVIYSRGVFCHVEDKTTLFKECRRILRPGGIFVIIDWLSAVQGEWGPSVQVMVELEELSICAETVSGYLNVLQDAGFKDIRVLNRSNEYAEYNETIVEDLKTPAKKAYFLQHFNQQLHEEAILGYEALARAMRSGEGMIIQFTIRKEAPGNDLTE